jgi:hypothetical protein
VGVTYDGNGTNFAISVKSPRPLGCASSIWTIETQIRLEAKKAFVWHFYLPRVPPARDAAAVVQGPSTAQGAQSSLMRAHLPAAEEPNYVVEASMTSRNAVERPALTAIRRDMTRA